MQVFMNKATLYIALNYLQMDGSHDSAKFRKRLLNALHKPMHIADEIEYFQSLYRLIIYNEVDNVV